MRRITYINRTSDKRKAGHPLAGRGFAVEGNKPAFIRGQTVRTNQLGG
ncbi:MAG: hypothetical protein A4E63_00738 [Syntrophorhabdus sp. PtaU1.Bin050]|nr:MAG: hypothetical protein A4E63_00738 [Syntrophorhabdus sp. PtaU1.Bin050]